MIVFNDDSWKTTSLAMVYCIINYGNYRYPIVAQGRTNLMFCLFMRKPTQHFATLIYNCKLLGVAFICL